MQSNHSRIKFRVLASFSWRKLNCKIFTAKAGTKSSNVHFNLCFADISRWYQKQISVPSLAGTLRDLNWRAPVSSWKVSRPWSLIEMIFRLWIEIIPWLRIKAIEWWLLIKLIARLWIELFVTEVAREELRIRLRELRISRPELWIEMLGIGAPLIEVVLPANMICQHRHNHKLKSKADDSINILARHLWPSRNSSFGFLLPSTATLYF